MVYVGDGVWDARVCSRAGIPFVGIATDGRGERLLAEGAICLFPDFGDSDLVFSSLYQIPRTA
ncbi:MAG: HAD family hydrolase, partial [Verrucomicrobia bacterium]|nr:HAD family hydrolase [Verrucomicrobiota bacterium]